MKVLIDIDEKVYNDIKEGNIHNYVRDVPEESIAAISNGILIPDNATNGDVITAILKSSKWARSTRNISLADEDSIFIEIGSNWWNSPYKTESEG